MFIGYIIFGVFALISWLISNNLKSKFERYSKLPVPRGMTGKDVAQKMLRDHGIFDVQIESTDGNLTDHYNPLTKTVNLSENVYGSSSVAAAAIAAHECGHAVQHAMGYAPLQLRSKLVPVVNFASSWMQWILLAGIIFVRSFPELMLVGIGLFTITTLFSFITLPVEINARARALEWLNTSGITTYETHDQAKDALKTAAYTYVVAALGSLATLVYYIMIYLGGSRR